MTKPPGCAQTSHCTNYAQTSQIWATSPESADCIQTPRHQRIQPGSTKHQRTAPYMPISSTICPYHPHISSQYRSPPFSPPSASPWASRWPCLPYSVLGRRCQRRWSWATRWHSPGRMRMATEATTTGLIGLRL